MSTILFAAGNLEFDGMVSHFSYCCDRSLQVDGDDGETAVTHLRNNQPTVSQVHTDAELQRKLLVCGRRKKIEKLMHRTVEHSDIGTFHSAADYSQQLCRGNQNAWV